jgi:hypothetical protein
MKDYPALHLDTEYKRLSSITLGHRTKKRNNTYIDVLHFSKKNLAKVTGPNQFSLAVGHWTTAKVYDC